MMTRYIITESGLAELDKYFIENKDSLIKIAWKNLKDKEIRPYNPQAEREKVLKQLHEWFNNYCEGNEDPDLWMAFLHAERALRTAAKDGVIE